MDQLWSLIQPLLPGASPTVVLVALGFIFNGKLKELRADMKELKECVPDCAKMQSACQRIRQDEERKIGERIASLEGGRPFKVVKTEG